MDLIVLMLYLLSFLLIRQIVVVDSGSTDKTAQLVGMFIEKYTDTKKMLARLSWR
jgi:hypothetical protein